MTMNRPRCAKAWPMPSTQFLAQGTAEAEEGDVAKTVSPSDLCRLLPIQVGIQLPLGDEVVRVLLVVGVDLAPDPLDLLGVELQFPQHLLDLLFREEVVLVTIVLLEGLLRVPLVAEKPLQDFVRADAEGLDELLPVQRLPAV